MRWNLRLVAARCGIWSATELRRQLADYGLVLSAGALSTLWSSQPARIKLADLDVICVVLRCGVDDLLIREWDRDATSSP